MIMIIIIMVCYHYKSNGDIIYRRQRSVHKLYYHLVTRIIIIQLLNRNLDAKFNF